MNFRNAFLISLVIGTVACAPKVDASSAPALITSIAKMRLVLNEKEREQLDSALLTVAFKDLRQADLIDIAEHADRVLPNAQAAIDGKTAEQIIAQSRRLSRQHNRRN